MTKRQFSLSTLFTSLALAGCIEATDPMAETYVAVEARTPALRTATDLARGVRWELHWGSVAAYDIATGRLIRTVLLPGATLSGATANCLPDMVLDRMGALIVSGNITTRMWRVSPARFEVEIFHIEPDADQEKDFGFTSIAWGANDRDLYAASAVTGSLWRIDMASAKATKVGVSELARNACGPALPTLAGSGQQFEHGQPCGGLVERHDPVCTLDGGYLTDERVAEIRR